MYGRTGRYRGAVGKATKIQEIGGISDIARKLSLFMI